MKQAIILAAGMGSRLRPLTDNIPKCLVEVNGISILENALKNLSSVGVENVIIVTGYLHQEIEKIFKNNFLNMNIKYEYNNKFEETNSMYSLYLGLKNVFEDVIILESDIMFEKDIISKEYLSDIVWYVDSNVKDIDGSYVKFDSNNTVIEHNIKRDLSLINKDDAKSLGILFLSNNGVTLMKDWLNCAIGENKENLYYDLILGEHLDSKLIKVNDIKNKRWFEIDNVEDLKKAKRIFI